MLTTIEDFRASLEAPEPPAGGATARDALWWAARGDWARAHGLVMNDPSAIAAAVHAYLHRVEGDLGNAGYWYGRAGRPAATDGLDAEWQRLVSDALAAGGG